MRTIDLLFDESGLSLQELAERSHLEESRVADILTGRWTPSPRDREKIAVALRVRIGIDLKSLDLTPKIRESIKTKNKE